MAILTKGTVDYSADPAIINTVLGAARSIMESYAGSMITFQVEPPGTPWSTRPTSGTYVNTRTWTNEADAQQFCTKITALLDANPTWRTFITSGTAVTIT